MDLAEAIATYEAPTEAPAEGTTPPATEPQTVATPTAPIQPEVPASGAVASDPFTPEALATPEGITAARAKITEIREELRASRQKIDSKTSKFEQTRQRHLAERARDQAERQQFHANLDVLRTGTYEQRLTLLSQLLNDQPHEVVRGLNLAALKKGPAPDKVATLEATVSDLQKQLQARTAAEEQARLEQEAEAKYRGELPNVIQSSDHSKTFPTIAQYLAEVDNGVPLRTHHLQEVVDATVRLRKQHFANTGQVLTEELAFLQVEHQLRQFYSNRPAAPPPAAVAPAAQAPSPPAQPAPVAPATGQSLTASELSDSGSRREMSEQESIEAIASDPEALALLKNMGLI
jgi:hypothetical protein